MLRTGLRVSECLSLRPADLRLNQDPPIISLRPEVTGNKAKRGREVPIPDDLVECLEDLVSICAKNRERPLIDHEVAGNSPVYSHGCKSPLPVAEGAAGNPSCRTFGRILYFRYSSQGCRWMTLYGYARVSVREPEDKNLDLQVERLVRAGCSMGNVRAEEASGAKDARDGLLELLDLVVEGDTLVVTHIDRLSRGLTYGLQVIEDLHLRGVEFRSLSEDFDTSTATGKLQLAMVLAFSEWWRNSIRDRSVAGQAKARAEGRFPGRRPSLTAQQRDYIRVERSKGVSQRELAKLLEVSRWTIQQVDR